MLQKLYVCGTFFIYKKFSKLDKVNLTFLLNFCLTVKCVILQIIHVFFYSCNK